MITCQNCNASLNQIGDVEFAIRCIKCGWFTKFRFGTLKEEEKIIKDLFGNPVLLKKQFGDGVLHTHQFDFRYIVILKRTSQKSGEALENFLLYYKEKLSLQEKNILYKFKAQSIPEIEEKIEYLEIKKKCIEILRFLEF